MTGKVLACDEDETNKVNDPHTVSSISYIRNNDSTRTDERVQEKRVFLLYKLRYIAPFLARGHHKFSEGVIPLDDIVEGGNSAINICHVNARHRPESQIHRLGLFVIESGVQTEIKNQNLLSQLS